MRKKDRPAAQPRTLVIRKGNRPACLKTGRQCRGCFGWRNMLHAARFAPAWQNRPFGCRLTGLALQVEATHAASAEC